MSLVAYDGSSDEQSEKEDEVSSSSMPSKKTREPVKIAIPSLREFKEVNDPEPIKKPKPQGGSGLFSMLPLPKNSSISSKPGFTPYIFSKKKDTKTNSQALSQKKAETVAIQVHEQKDIAEPLIEPDSSVDSDAEDTSEKVDFFSLETSASSDRSASKLDTESTLGDCATKLPLLLSNPVTSEVKQYSPAISSSEVAESTDCVVSETGWGSSTSFATLPEECLLNEAPSSSWEPSSSETAVDANPQQEFLKDEGFLRLKGKRGKEEINIIDVNADDQLTGRDEWIMKSLTEEKVQRPSKRRHDMPTSQQKRKHQITYLAFQAKERELDLKNQWAHNSRTKRETQAKYGF